MWIVVAASVASTVVIVGHADLRLKSHANRADERRSCDSSRVRAPRRRSVLWPLRWQLCALVTDDQAVMPVAAELVRRLPPLHLHHPLHPLHHPQPHLLPHLTTSTAVLTASRSPPPSSPPASPSSSPSARAACSPARGAPSSRRCSPLASSKPASGSHLGRSCQRRTRYSHLASGQAAHLHRRHRAARVRRQDARPGRAALDHVGGWRLLARRGGRRRRDHPARRLAALRARGQGAAGGSTLLRRGVLVGHPYFGPTRVIGADDRGMYSRLKTVSRARPRFCALPNENRSWLRPWGIWATEALDCLTTRAHTHNYACVVECVRRLGEELSLT